jgi:hypothetical protein
VKSLGLGVLILIVILVLILFILWIIAQPVDQPGEHDGKVVFVSSQVCMGNFGAGPLAHGAIDQFDERLQPKQEENRRVW